MVMGVYNIKEKMNLYLDEEHLDLNPEILLDAMSDATDGEAAVLRAKYKGLCGFRENKAVVPELIQPGDKVVGSRWVIAQPA
jgi:hypothetical protein